MTRLELIERLKAMRACGNSLAWLRSLDCETAAECWEWCDRLDWMLWLIANTMPRLVLVGLACDYAKRVLPIAEAWLREHEPDLADAPREAIAAAREGRVTESILRRAHAAYAAAYAVVYASAEAAYAAYAAYAAADAADTAAAAASDDAAYAAQDAAFTTAERAWQLAHTRSVVPWIAIEELIR